MNTNIDVPEWLRDLVLGYGDPAFAHYKNMKLPSLDWNDTFLSYEHLNASFPDYVIVNTTKEENKLVPPFRITFTDLPSVI